MTTRSRRFAWWRSLRYNFPAAGLTDEALQALLMMVFSTGADVRQTLIGDA